MVPPGLAEALGPLVAGPPSAAQKDLPGLTAGLLQYAAGCEQNRQLAEQALAKHGGRDKLDEADVSELADWVSRVEQAYFQWHRGQTGRQLADEIATRTVPMRDHWDARGPGMIRQIERLTEPWLVAERVEVVMVLPVVGGDGMAHLPANVVTIEALLANVDPQLPEVVRLAWLASQLQFDLPAIAEQIPPGRLPHIAALAMLPATLAAAEAVELAEYSTESLSSALQLWRVASTAAEVQPLAETLTQWWDSYQSSDMALAAAVASLEATLVE